MSDQSASSSTQVPAIRVENLTFKYPIMDHPALEDVNFSIHKGELLGIMGPSGAGKTTLCQILKGLIPYSLAGELKGDVFIDGTRLDRDNLIELTKRVGFVFQDPETQIIGLTVEEDLAFGPENYQWPRERMLAAIPEVLDLVRMTGYEKRETWNLSGGQKQRVAIASSLILEPEILILDEPTSELDPIGKAEVFETIHRLKEEKNVTVIVVEHEIEELAELADRILLFDKGHLIDQGKPIDLFRKVKLFEEYGGERVPHIAELLVEMQSMNYLRPDQFAVKEAEGIALLKSVLESKR